MGESEARRRAAWRFVRAVVRSEVGGVIGAVVSGLPWPTGAILAPLVSLAAWMYSRRYDARTRRLQEAWADAATLVEETISGIRVVKGLGAGSALSGRFRARSDEIVGRALDVARLDAVFNPVLEA